MILYLMITVILMGSVYHGLTRLAMYKSHRKFSILNQFSRLPWWSKVMYVVAIAVVLCLVSVFLHNNKNSTTLDQSELRYTIRELQKNEDDAEDEGNMQVMNMMKVKDLVTFPRGSLQKRVPDCVLIGVRKGGTGPVEHFLSQHPQVVTPAREISFFNIDSR